jgi:hypothetical protein
MPVPIFYVHIAVSQFWLMFTRQDLPDQENSKATGSLVVWQVCPSHIIVLSVVTSDSELIYRHCRSSPQLDA